MGVRVRGNAMPPSRKIKRTVYGVTSDEIDFEYATATAARTLRAMADHGVPPIPTNFHLWFEYVRGAMPDLKRAVDGLIDTAKPFDAATNRNLYATFIGTQGVGAFEKMSQELHHVMESAKQSLTAAIAENRTQIEAIDHVAEQSEAGVDPQLLIRNLTSELAKATERAAKLEEGFAAQSRELNTIRDEMTEAEERARTDTLTGLPNRRALDEFCRMAQQMATEQRKPLSVLMIDVDHFKRFNDNYGHNVGDQVLRLVGKALRSKMRDSDMPARYGGEELIAVLPDTPLELCTEIADQIRRAIEQCQIVRRSTGEVIPSLTVSIGVGQFRIGEQITDLIERCDRALYLAKRLGRNRVVTELDLDRELAAS